MSENDKTPLLDTIALPADLRKLPENKLRQVADELRQEMIDAVSNTGGHLGAGLGVVELTVALHYIFDTPDDKILWDVGHQAYPHKILTGRRDRIRTLRQGGGLSGFTSRRESEYDPFGAAHSSTSISAGLGFAVARDLRGADNDVVAVIGDGAMSAGMAYEAMNNAGANKSRLIVILNDNDMSIAPPVGAMSAYLARLISAKPYRSMRHLGRVLAKKFPRPFENAARRAEEYARGMLTGGTLFEELGFYYVGPIDGHNLDPLLPVLRNAKSSRSEGPILVHVVTQKGKGYDPAENAADKYHGVSKFDVVTGKQLKPAAGAPSYTNVYAKALIAEAEQDDRIVAVTAAMPTGTGIDKFSERFPERSFDIGIAGELSWIADTGLLMTNERISINEYMTFDTELAPFNRTVSDHDDDAFTRILVILGGQGGDGLAVSGDGETVMWLIRTSHDPNNYTVTVRIAELEGLENESANDAGRPLITHSARTQSPDFPMGFSLSEDGSTFAISLKSGHGFDLYLMDGSTGEEIRQLTTSGLDSGLENLYPDISEDGQWVAFSSQAGAEGRPDLHVINIDGSGLAKVTGYFRRKRDAAFLVTRRPQTGLSEPELHRRHSQLGHLRG